MDTEKSTDVTFAVGATMELVSELELCFPDRRDTATLALVAATLLLRREVERSTKLLLFNRGT